MQEAAHNHTATFERCLQHLKDQGFDAEAAHRICYSVGAGGEGAVAAERREAAAEPIAIGVSLLEDAATIDGTAVGGLFEAALRESKVDQTKRLIENVVLVGPTSPTRRREYPARTLREALPLYEGTKVYLDHPAPGSEGRERSVRDLAGHVVKGSVRLDESGKLRGSIQTTTTEAGKTLLELAQNTPDLAGMSHNAVGAEREEGDRRIIERIAAVRSVDVVTDPGTTKGFHESADPGAPTKETDSMDPKEIAKLTLTQVAAANPALVESIREDARREVRDKELKPVQEAKDKAEAELAQERGGRLVESVLAKHKNLPKVTADGIRKTLKGQKDLTEAKVEAVVEQAKSYLTSVGVKLDDRGGEGTGKGKKGKAVTESAAAIPADDASGEDDDEDDLVESMAPLMGVSLEKDDDEDDDE